MTVTGRTPRRTDDANVGGVYDRVWPWERTGEYGSAWDPAFGPFVASPAGTSSVEDDPGSTAWRWQRLLEPDPADADPADVLMIRIEAAEGLVTQLLADQARHLEQLHRLRTSRNDPTAPAREVDPDGWMPTEVALTLGLTTNQVRKRLLYAAGLTTYPQLRRLVGDGAVPAFTAQKLVEGLDRLTPYLPGPDLAHLETDLVTWLRSQRPTVAALDRRLRALLLDAQARANVTTDESLYRAHAAREVRVTTCDDGTAELWALLPEADALAVAAILREHGLTPTDENDTRTPAQRRADILVGRTTGAPAVYGHPADIPDRQHGPGVTVAVDVTVPVDTITSTGTAPGHVPGHGHVPAETARDLVAHPTARFRALLHDSGTGHLLGIAPTGDLTKITWLRDSTPANGYQHPTTMDTLTRARDHACRFPHCTRPARHCDADHIIPWPTGRTSPTNTATLCRYHHRLKTHAHNWTTAGTGNGPLLWTTPTRTTITTHPHDHRAVTTHPDDDPPPY